MTFKNSKQRKAVMAKFKYIAAVRKDIGKGRIARLGFETKSDALSFKRLILKSRPKMVIAVKRVDSKQKNVFVFRGKGFSK